MALDDRRIFGDVSQVLPSVSQDGQTKAFRASRRGDQIAYVTGKPNYELADSGCYFVARNPTAGSGIAGIADVTGVSDTKTLLFLRNDNSVASGKRIYIDYLKLITTAAGTNGTTTMYWSKLDTGASRVGTGGTSITGKNCNMADSTASGATLAFGAVASGAASANVRYLTSGNLRSVITVVGDEYLFDFGAQACLPRAAVVTTGTAVVNIVTKHPPVVLGPTDQFLFGIGAASQSAASSFEFEIGWWER
jgi:hypothetical protein